MALKTEQAPCLSLCIPAIEGPGLRFKPPVSKHTPLPTRLMKSLLEGSPLYYKLTIAGWWILALPTACINLKPSYSNYLPFITVIFSFYLYFDPISSALYSMKVVVASLALEFAHSAALILLCTSSRMYSFYCSPYRAMLIYFSSFSFLENLYPFISTSDAIPMIFLLACIPSENLTEVLLLISPIFFQLCSLKYDFVIYFFYPSYSMT